MTDKPTPKEIDDLVYELRQAGKDDTYSLASAVLAKWGSPAPVGAEPVALLVRKNSWRDGQWEVAPPNSPSYGLAWANQRMYVYAAPQPTQPQAGAVPLTGEYPALVCDYCGALTPDPWHSSGMLHGKMSKHIHSCDACCRGAAQAAPTYKDSTPELHIGDSAFESWYSTYSPAHKSDKQRARDAYTAGMGDPLVVAAPTPQSAAQDAELYQFIRNRSMEDRNKLEHYSKDALDKAIRAAIAARAQQKAGE